MDGVDLLEEFALDCPTLRAVPGSARGVAAEATEELCRAVLRAPEGTLAEERAWKLLLLRERLLFAAPLRLTGANKQSRRNADEQRQDLGRLVLERASALLRGEWADLLASSQAFPPPLALARIPPE